jgi:hypothetical protein
MRGRMGLDEPRQSCEVYHASENIQDISRIDHSGIAFSNWRLSARWCDATRSCLAAVFGAICILCGCRRATEQNNFRVGALFICCCGLLSFDGFLDCPVAAVIIPNRRGRVGSISERDPNNSGQQVELPRMHDQRVDRESD